MRVSPTIIAALSLILLLGASRKTVVAQVWQPGFHKLLGQPAPKLDLSEWINDKPKTLDKLKGKVVLLDIFQIICPGCHMAHPRIVEFQKRYGKQGLEVLGIAVAFEYQSAQRPDRIKKYVKANAYPYPVAIDRNMTATFRKYQSGGTPWTVLIDRDGKVRYADFFREQKIEAKIKKLLAEHGEK